MTNSYQETLAALNEMITTEATLEQEIARLGLLVQLEASQQTTAMQDSSAMVIEPALSADWIRWQNALKLREKHREWGKKTHGIAMGYAREMQSSHKNFFKGRAVGFENADVTVGTNEMYAKAIQHKHTISAENSAVNEMIAKAANQLTGESGETPLSSQRKVIDVMINNQNNWWPFDQKDFADLNPEVDLNSGIIPFNRLQARGQLQVLTQLLKYKKGKSGLNAATMSSLHNHVSGANGKVPDFYNSNSTKATSLHLANGTRIEVMAVKIIYGHPRKFKGPQGVITVSKVVFSVYRKDNNLQVWCTHHSG